jgi:hypothetical protein
MPRTRFCRGTGANLIGMLLGVRVSAGFVDGASKRLPGRRRRTRSGGWTPGLTPGSLVASAAHGHGRTGPPAVPARQQAGRNLHYLYLARSTLRYLYSCTSNMQYMQNSGSFLRFLDLRSIGLVFGSSVMVCPFILASYCRHFPNRQIGTEM